MKELEHHQKKLKTHTICCYNVDQNQDDQPKQRRHENVPMVGRQVSSDIRFKNVQHNNRQPIYQLLNDLYQQGANHSAIYALLANKRINPIIHGGEQRDDLEYYIPQIITYMVLEKNLKDQELISFILKGCSTDFYFAHRVYFSLKSLSENHQGHIISSVCQFLEEKFVNQMNMYRYCKLSGLEFTKSMVEMDNELKTLQIFNNTPESILEEIQPEIQSQTSIDLRMEQQLWNKYGTKLYPNPFPLFPKTIPKVKRKRYFLHGFMQTPKFWDDMLEIGSRVSKVPLDIRNNELSNCIMEMNEKLPANVYIPFFKEEIRMYTILCIWKGRLFSTNQRAPYSIWVELYREEQELNLEKAYEVQEEEDIKEQPVQKQKKKNFLDKIYQTISKPFSISGQKNTLNLNKRLSPDKLSPTHETASSKLRPNRSNRSAYRSFAQQPQSHRRYSISDIYEQCQKQAKSQGRESIDSRSRGSSINSVHNDQSQLNIEERMAQFFGPKSSDYIQQVRERSIYRQLKSWRLFHLMVKTGDDIKQQQFAMQLINRFQYAFTKEKVDCVVFPYQVISLGPQCGIIEMLNDITTLNSLFEKLYRKSMTLRQFFDKIYPNPAQARRNFMRSLAGYSILSYFLQVKDRHNGNILLSRQGYIIHIDFGFFLSNAPGRGVQLQKNVPFKLLTSYVQVIGQLNSDQFFQFRRLFYKGFRAVLKEKDAILTLVRMMYSSHMESMGCFIKGQLAIEELQHRFSIDQHVESFCYDLINSSLDNWRARWYDKFQYFLQKIYY